MCEQCGEYAAHLNACEERFEQLRTELDRCGHAYEMSSNKLADAEVKVKKMHEALVEIKWVLQQPNMVDALIAEALK